MSGDLALYGSVLFLVVVFVVGAWRSSGTRQLFR